MENNIKSDIERMIEMKNRERQIADLFYQMCPSVPPQLLASTVRATIENLKKIQDIYSGITIKQHMKDCKYCGKPFLYERSSKICCDRIECQRQMKRENTRRCRARKKEKESLADDAADGIRYAIESMLENSQKEINKDIPRID